LKIEEDRWELWEGNVKFLMRKLVRQEAEK